MIVQFHWTLLRQPRSCKRAHAGEPDERFSTRRAAAPDYRGLGLPLSVACAAAASAAGPVFDTAATEDRGIDVLVASLARLSPGDRRHVAALLRSMLAATDTPESLTGRSHGHHSACGPSRRPHQRAAPRPPCYRHDYLFMDRRSTATLICDGQPGVASISRPLVAERDRLAAPPGDGSKQIDALMFVKGLG